MTQKEAEQMLEKIASELGEHFDAVQIMVSFNEEGESIAMNRGGRKLVCASWDGKRTGVVRRGQYILETEAGF